MSRETNHEPRMAASADVLEAESVLLDEEMASVDDMQTEQMASGICGDGENNTARRRSKSMANSADLEAAEMMAAVAAASRARADNMSISSARRHASLSTHSTRSFRQHHSRASSAVDRGEHSNGSSLYGSSLGNTASIATGPVSIVNGGTLSPPYTLVNSDGASMRVHTGSIRERHMQHRISAIHEDDSDVYSDSLVFTYDVPSGSSRYYPASVQQSQLQEHRQQGRADSDGMSMMSGLSEGGASTTRVRMATDRAYNALRIGPQAASLLSYYSGQTNGLHHVTSYAASSDPGGLARTASYYDMYYMDHGRCSPDHERYSDNNDEDTSHMGRDDIVSLIRSDVAVYGGAHEDVKFPFLTDNMSEFSGPFICSSAGPLDVDRISRDYSEFMYYASPSHYQAHSPQFFDYTAFDPRTEHMQSPPVSATVQPPLPQLQAQGVGEEDHMGKKIKRKKKKDTRLTPRYPRNKQRAGTTPADYVAASGTSPLGVRQPMATASSVVAHPWRHATRRYRHQSAGESVYQSAAVAAMVAVSTDTSPPPVPRQSNSGHTTPAPIRPNAIMRFLKRIAPRN
ncbi:hypothetical protein IW147_002500 [Coemansia sp. RSA 720]|nr:hypothetical protein IW147_002500 [Coemansia sp. RSA 720]